MGRHTRPEPKIDDRYQEYGQMIGRHYSQSPPMTVVARALQDYDRMMRSVHLDPARYLEHAILITGGPFQGKWHTGWYCNVTEADNARLERQENSNDHDR